MLIERSEKQQADTLSDLLGMAPGKLDSLEADSLKPLVQQLLMRIDDLLAQNKALLARIAELEAKLGQPPKTPDCQSARNFDP